MAGASRRLAAAPRPRVRARLCRRRQGNPRDRAQRFGGAVSSRLPRRLSALVFALFAGGLALAAEPPAEQLRAVRVWPAPEYTRVTLESAEPLQHKLTSIKGPDRLGVGLGGGGFPG